MTKELMWTSVEAPGYEHVRIDEGHPEWTVFDSMFVRVHEGDVRRGGYTLIVDKAWRTLEIRLMVEHAPGQMAALHLLASGDGAWTDADGNRLPELAGCIDVDIQWSPLTNTLPVRRLGLTPGQEQDIRVAYLPLPGLGARPLMQRYVGIDDHRVRYESPTRDFQRDISIDDDGFVVEYLGLFTRSWPEAPDT